MNLKHLMALIVMVLAFTMLAGCSPEPQVIVVEITRLVAEVEEVEVTRIVEVEKEVTRIVELPAEAKPGAPSAEYDQNRMHDLDFLQLEFWPDYDQASVLVLMTGGMPSGTDLPVVVAIPIPEGAEINAIAQIDEGGMTSIDYSLAGDAVVFETGTPGFRVEYYVPYQRDGNVRSYTFEWPAPFSVEAFGAQIQRPFNASTLTSAPAPSSIVTETADGLDYYVFDPQPSSQGIPLRLQFSYEMISDGLTVDQLHSPAPQLPDNSPLHDQQARGGRLARNS